MNKIEIGPMYSVSQVAALTGRSVRTVRRWFLHEPGVLVVLDNPATLHKRRYRTLRIPAAVYRRVIEAKKLC